MGGPIMPAISVRMGTIFGPLLNQDCMHIWSLSWPRLQANMVPILTDIACICGPYLDRYCKHNWFSFKITKTFEFNNENLVTLYRNWGYSSMFWYFRSANTCKKPESIKFSNPKYGSRQLTLRNKNFVYSFLKA